MCQVNKRYIKNTGFCLDSMSKNILSDEKLVQAVRKGNSDSLSVLLSRYLPIIKMLVSKRCFNSDRFDDLVQEAYIGLLGALSSFDETMSSFKTFASLCIDRAVISATRTKVNNEELTDAYLDLCEELPDPKLTENIVLEKEEFRRVLAIARFKLSSFEYDTLLKYVDGFTYNEIAEQLSTTKKSVDNAIQRTRTKISKILNN